MEGRISLVDDRNLEMIQGEEERDRFSTCKKHYESYQTIGKAKRRIMSIPEGKKWKGATFI